MDACHGYHMGVLAHCGNTILEFMRGTKATLPVLCLPLISPNYWVSRRQPLDPKGRILYYVLDVFETTDLLCSKLFLVLDVLHEYICLANMEL